MKGVMILLFGSFLLAILAKQEEVRYTEMNARMTADNHSSAFLDFHVATACFIEGNPAHLGSLTWQNVLDYDSGRCAMTRKQVSSNVAAQVEAQQYYIYTTSAAHAQTLAAVTRKLHGSLNVGVKNGSLLRTLSRDAGGAPISVNYGLPAYIPDDSLVIVGSR